MKQLIADFGTDRWYQLDGYFNGGTAPWMDITLKAVETGKHEFSSPLPPISSTYPACMFANKPTFINIKYFANVCFLAFKEIVLSFVSICWSPLFFFVNVFSASVLFYIFTYSLLFFNSLRIFQQPISCAILFTIFIISSTFRYNICIKGTWGSETKDTYSYGCAASGCRSFTTVDSAKAACIKDVSCSAITCAGYSSTSRGD